MAPRIQLTRLWQALQLALPPFLVSRGVVWLTICVYQLQTQGHVDPNRAALVWDGSWFAEIALHGYSITHADTSQSALPFFPLLPLLLRLAHGIGIPIGISGSLINQLGLLIGLSLVAGLARVHLEISAVRQGLWLMALFPGSAAFSLCYSDGLFLAFSTAALLCQQQGKHRLAGSIAAFATLSRPNGLIIAIALSAQALSHRMGKRVVTWLVAPSVLAITGWSIWIWRFSGQPLAWITAKQAWREHSLFDVFLQTKGFPWIDLLLGLCFLGLCLAYRNHWPLAWTFFGVLSVLPSLLTGLTGMPRYLVSCFPAFLGLGRLIGRQHWMTICLVVLFNIKLVTATLNIVSQHSTP